MFACGAPKKQLLADVTREREALQQENETLRHRCEKLLKEQDGWQGERAGWVQQREELMSELRARADLSIAQQKLAARVKQALQEDTAAAAAVQVYVSAEGEGSDADAEGTEPQAVGAPRASPEHKSVELEGVLGESPCAWLSAVKTQFLHGREAGKVPAVSNTSGCPPGPGGSGWSRRRPKTACSAM